MKGTGGIRKVRVAIGEPAAFVEELKKHFKR
jgi:hypothetical protein